MSNGKNSGASWITIAIFLAIPVLRFIGIFMLIKKVTHLISLSKKQTDLVYVLAAILMFTSAGEILSWIKTSIFASVIPLSAIAVAVVGFCVSFFLSDVKNNVEKIKKLVNKKN